MLLNSEIVKICGQEIIKPVNAGACNYFVDAVARRLGFGNMFTGMNADSMFNALCKGFNTRRPKAGIISPYSAFQSLDDLLRSNPLGPSAARRNTNPEPLTVDQITREYFDSTEVVIWKSLQRNYAAAIELAKAGHFVLAASGSVGGHGHVAVIVDGEANRTFGMIPVGYWGRYLHPEKAGINQAITKSWRESALNESVMCFSTAT